MFSMGESKELPTRPMRMLGFAIIIIIIIIIINIIIIIIWLFLWFVLYQIFFLCINLVWIKKPICWKSEITSRRRKRLIRFIVVCLFLKTAHESFQNSLPFFNIFWSTKTVPRMV